MKSIGVSNDLPDYLKSKFSVNIPSRKDCMVHRSFRTPLRQGVSDESPKHFHISYVPVLDNAQKNQNISTDSKNSRFLSALKKNLPFNKPHFEYSEIQGQKFDYDTLKFIEGLDVKAGHSARLARLMGFNEMYSKTLSEGFGRARGDFVVELSQANVPRSEGRDVHRLKNYLRKTSKKWTQNEEILGLPKNKAKDYSLCFHKTRNVNTPNKRLRRRKNIKSESVSLAELDSFEADMKSKQSLWNSTAMYKEF
jgi:hypothetical protein